MSSIIEVLQLLADDAKKYRGGAVESIRRNNHMNNNTSADIDQRDIDAILVDFINFVGMRRGVDYAMYTRDLGQPEPPNVKGGEDAEMWVEE